MSENKTTDFNVLNEGSIILLNPITAAAGEWVDEHILAGNDEVQMWGSAVVVEPRFIEDILRGIVSDGLTYAWR